MTRAAPRWAAALLAALASVVMAAAGAQALTPHQQLARDILQELVEIDTVTASGDTLKAAQAMAARLRAAGFAEADVRVLSAAPRKGNLVARLRGSGARRPILLLAHLDVVPAKPEDWSVDPFRLLERDGYFYGRGVEDDKSMAAALVANLIRYRQEGFRPDRDLIVVLETDEEIGDANQVGIRWLLQHHRELIDAEFALNEGGGVGLVNGRATIVSVQTSEKVPLNFRLEVKRAATARCRRATTRSTACPTASCGCRASSFRSASPTPRAATSSAGPRWRRPHWRPSCERSSRPSPAPLPWRGCRAASASTC